MSTHDFSVVSTLSRRRLTIEYDVNVLVLTHYQSPYNERLRWFKSLGLVRREHRRVHVTVVCSLGDGPHLEEVVDGWPEGIDVTALEMGSRHPLPKLNGVYLWLRNNPIRSRWLLRVDDDSLTDIDGLLSRQEERFGDIAVHIMTSPYAVGGDEPPSNAFRAYLEHRDIHLYSYQTEYEASLTSERAMSRIYESAIACEFLTYTAGTFAAPSDRCLAIAARIVGVPTVEGSGMYHQFARDNLSLAGGGLEHIHYVDWQDENFREMLWAFENGKRSPLPATAVEHVRDNSLPFGRCVGHPLHTLTFDLDGRLFDARDELETFWEARPSMLLLKSASGRPTTAFDTLLQGERSAWLIGPSLVTPYTHYLALGAVTLG